MKKAIIIGAGIGGLSTAIRLSKRNYLVEVFEKNSQPGGKLSQKSIGKYRFDLGPSLFTRPDLVLELLNSNSTQDFPFKKLDVLCHYFYENGKSFIATANHQEFAHEMEKSFSEPHKNTLKFIEKSKKINEIAGKVFLENSLHKASTYFKIDTLKSMLQLHKIDAFRTMNQANEASFETAEAVQLFNRYATYNGSDPYQTPATLNLISTLEMLDGAYFPKNGMHQITEALYNSALENGVKFNFNQGVEKIVYHKNKASSIITEDSKSHNADVFISNMDSYFTYSKLLDMPLKATKIEKLERSGSALIFYWGIKKTFPDLDLHNIFFSADYKKEFESIFKTKTIYNDPTVYVNITSKYNKSDAPDGCENWFVMINVPAKPELFDKVNISVLKKCILMKLERILKTEIAPFIEIEDVLTPGLIQQKTSSYLGALYGTASNKKFSAFFRPPNFNSSLKNLYFCGGSVHPGGGIPLCLLSAKIVDNLID